MDIAEYYIKQQSNSESGNETHIKQLTYPAKISLLSCENFIEKAQNLASSGLNKRQVKPQQLKIFQGKVL